MCGWVECLASSRTSWASCEASFPLSLINTIATVNWFGLKNVEEVSNFHLFGAREIVNLMISDWGQCAAISLVCISVILLFMLRGSFIWIRLSYFKREPSCMSYWEYHLKQGVLNVLNLKPRFWFWLQSKQNNPVTKATKKIWWIRWNIQPSISCCDDESTFFVGRVNLWVQGKLLLKNTFAPLDPKKH